MVGKVERRLIMERATIYSLMSLIGGTLLFVFFLSGLWKREGRIKRFWDGKMTRSFIVKVSVFSYFCLLLIGKSSTTALLFLLLGLVATLFEMLFNLVLKLNKKFNTVSTTIKGTEGAESNLKQWAIAATINQFPLPTLRSDLIGIIKRIDAKYRESYDGSESGLALSNSLDALKQMLQDEKTSTLDVLSIKILVETLEK